MVQIKSVVSKTINKELRSRVITPPTAQLRFNHQFPGDILDWKKVYSLPFRVTSYTKLHEFQYKVLNKCLTTNVFLHKISIMFIYLRRVLFVEMRTRTLSTFLHIVTIPRVSGQK